MGCWERYGSGVWRGREREECKTEGFTGAGKVFVRASASLLNPEQTANSDVQGAASFSHSSSSDVLRGRSLSKTRPSGREGRRTSSTAALALGLQLAFLRRKYVFTCTAFFQILMQVSVLSTGDKFFISCTHELLIPPAPLFWIMVSTAILGTNLNKSELR